MAEITIPKETQRFIVAMTLIIGFLASFLYIFHTTGDLEIARTVLSVLSGAVSAVIGYFFGAKSMEVRK
jgi:membrane associated rhomboid family serine protease